MIACANAAKALFDRVQARWKNNRVVSITPKHKPRPRAWQLNLDIKGHRVSDFPHAIHRGGDLGDFEHYPNAGLWILEIQIAEGMVYQISEQKLAAADSYEVAHYKRVAVGLAPGLTAWV